MSTVTRGQRIGLAMVAMFYGQLVSAILLSLAIVARNASDFRFVVHHWPVFSQVILVSVALEACVAAATWMLFALPLLAFVSPDELRRYRAVLFAAGAGIGALACGLLYGALLVRAHHAPDAPRTPGAAVAVTFFYSAIMAVVAFWRYFKLHDDAALLTGARRRLASTGNS